MICMKNIKQNMLKLVLLGLFLCRFANALDFGMPPSEGSTQCSRECKSEFCSELPFLKYGKYCGVSYTGCPGETPCDDVDACCMFHDACVTANNNDYLSTLCNENLLSCLGAVKNAGEKKTFQGNTCSTDDVSNEISFVVEAALVANRVLNKP